MSIYEVIIAVYIVASHKVRASHNLFGTTLLGLCGVAAQWWQAKVATTRTATPKRQQIDNDLAEGI